jgi:UDP-glucose 4-epimerase
MPNILITGANSFVGSNYKRYSKYKNINEICLIKNKASQIDFNNIDVVFHVAAIVHQKDAIPEKTYFSINTELPIELAKRAKKAGVKQFIFMSTVKVYGKFKPGMQNWNESSKCFPDDSYGKSKYAAEQALKELENEYFTISIVRTPLVYGENVKANMHSILKLVYSFPVLPLGKINNKRSFTSVENLVGFIDRIIEKRASGIFIAMDEKSLSTTELVKLIAKYLNKKIILFKLPNFIIKIGILLIPQIFNRLFGSFEMNNEKTLNTLDYKASISSEEGIKKMIHSYKQPQ